MKIMYEAYLCSLYCKRFSTGSQCSCCSTGVMCARLGNLVMMRAAVFCTLWRRLMMVLGKPCSKAFAYSPNVWWLLWVTRPATSPGVRRLRPASHVTLSSFFCKLFVFNNSIIQHFIMRFNQVHFSKARSNICVFVSFLKLFLDMHCRIVNGRLFQSLGAIAQKARSPHDLRCVRGTESNSLSVDLNDRDGAW